MERLVDRFGRIAAAAGAEALEIRVDLVEVVRERIEARHVVVAAVAVGDEPDPHLAAGALHDAAGDGPDLLLGALDETGHRAGGVEDEDDLGVDGRGIGRGRRGNRGDRGKDEGQRTKDGFHG